MEKIKSGVYGLNALFGGGISRNSTTVVIGPPGAGKTTFAVQFIKRGLESGQDSVFVSLDESQDQIINTAIKMGWSKITEYIDHEKLIFVDASGEQFTNFIRKKLPQFVEEWKGSDGRIAVDPLTPVIWSIKEQYEQRELLLIMLKEFSKVGTVLCTLEEHGTLGDLSGPEALVPMYLADSVVHLKYMRRGGMSSRHVEIIKCRGSKHSEDAHPYQIIHGLGLVVYNAMKTEQAPRDVTNQLSSLVTKNRDRLPSFVYDQLIETWGKSGNIDTGELGPEFIVSSIIDEYGETKDKKAEQLRSANR